ncbi:MAG TPA: tol-pal system protein YbgF [Xanthobacteraceae bacterium]|nr:tol-pal system protein YbgF [Xanthobacteraceae bacterium]
MIPLREKTLAMALGAMVGMLPAAVSATGPDGAPQGREATAGASTAFKVAQVPETDLLMRLDRLDDQVRQLTGAIEQLQYHNQQLEQQLRRLQETAEPRSGTGRSMGSSGPGGQGPVGPSGQPLGSGGQGAIGPGGMAADRYPPPPPGGSEPYPPPGQRRAEVFDPSQNPYAPGAPRPLGSPPAGGPDPAMGAPGGRGAGAPLDLSTLSDGQAPAAPYPGGAGLPPPPRNPNTSERLVMAPSNSPKDEFDLAYGYVLRKDYALAEDSFRAFLRTYPNDRLAADAHYWLGESLFQRQRYRDAAEAFLTVSTRYETAAKAPEALVRLGQSLAALGEKDAACGTFGEIGRKYPRAGMTVKQMTEREQKRVGC